MSQRQDVAPPEAPRSFTREEQRRLRQIANCELKPLHMILPLLGIVLLLAGVLLGLRLSSLSVFAKFGYLAFFSSLVGSIWLWRFKVHLTRVKRAARWGAASPATLVRARRNGRRWELAFRFKRDSETRDLTVHVPRIAETAWEEFAASALGWYAKPESGRGIKLEPGAEVHLLFDARRPNLAICYEVITCDYAVVEGDSAAPEQEKPEAEEQVS